MSLLMIRCPRTGLGFSTGIDTDRDSFKKIPEVLGFAWCPHCQSEHSWWNDEAWLADRPEQENSIAA